MQKFLMVTALILLLWIPSASATTLTLKSGKVIEGTVVEKTDESITVQEKDQRWKLFIKDLDEETSSLMHSLPIEMPSVSAGYNQGPPFEVRISFAPRIEGVGMQVIAQLKNISNESQKIIMLGCSENWETDNPEVPLYDICMSTMEVHSILEPGAEMTDEHNIGIKSDAKFPLVFRLGYKNLNGEWGAGPSFGTIVEKGEYITKDKVAANQEYYNKIPIYKERTWSNPLTIDNP